MLAPAAAGSVLELDCAIHCWVVFVFSFFGKSLFLPLLWSLLDSFSLCRYLLIDSRFRLDSDGPDEAQQFASYGGDDLALVLASRRQPGVALGEPDLRLPGNLLDPLSGS